MTLREKILKTFVVTIREVNAHGGPERFFKDYPVGGLYFGEDQIFYDANGREAGMYTTRERLAECRQASKSPLLVCADGVHFPGQTVPDAVRSLGASTNPKDAYEVGKVIGMQMNDCDVDWVLQPIVDMYFDKNHAMPLMATCDSPEKTARIYREVVRGIQDQGVCATVKHFPGLGTNLINMHFAPSDNRLSFDDWMASYGYIYKEMEAAGALSVMTTHASLKSYAPESENGYYPTATFSKKLTTELLKEIIGFSGAVVSDALIMGGMATGDLMEETVQAFRAGADLLLWPPVEAAERIEELLLCGDIPMARLEDALARIERMEDHRKKALENKAFSAPDPAEVDRIMSRTTEHGICLLRNRLSLLPLSKESGKRVLIVDASEEGDGVGAGYLRDELALRGMTAEVKRDIYDVPSRVCWQADIDRLQAQYDWVIFHLDAHYMATWSVPLMLVWASHLFQKSKKIIVNYGSPYFAGDYFPEDPTYIEMNASPSKESARLLAERLFGEASFVGESLIQ